jgi:hypothetical protein
MTIPAYNAARASEFTIEGKSNQFDGVPHFWTSQNFAWTDYTPAWTSSGTAPALGNGTIEGRYLHIGDMVMARFLLTIGSTSTNGSGDYRISMPNTVSADTPDSTEIAYGVGLLWDNNTSQVANTIWKKVATGTATVMEASWTNITGSAVWAINSPFTLATDDRISGFVQYISTTRVEPISVV